MSKPGLIKRVATAVRNYWISYRGAERWSADRGFVPGWVVDARFDASQATRWELVRKSRYFEKNNAIFNRLADVFEQYVFGSSGLIVVPSSLVDDEWNERTTDAWNDWCERCDISSNLPFSTLQRVAGRDWFVDGEGWIHKLQVRTAAGRAPEPRIELIECHRVGTPDDRQIDEGKTISDGTVLDPKTGRPLAYYIRDFTDSWQRVDANMMVQLGDVCRPHQYRFLPYVTPVIPDLTDLDDLQILEMRAAKDAAEKSTFFLNESGELDHRTLRAARVTGTTQTSGGVENEQARIEWYRKAIGGRVMALKRGEDVKQFLPNRPTPATQELWDYLTSKVCAGVGIPKLLVFPESMQGTVVRADLDVANAFFRSKSSVAGRAMLDVYRWWLDWAVKNDVRVADPPADYRRATVRAPRQVNVDVGRNSAARIAELEALAITYEDHFAELGQDWRQMFRQASKETAFLKRCAEEEGVTVQEIKVALAKIAKPAEPAPDAAETDDTEAEQPETDGEELTAETETE